MSKPFSIPVYKTMSFLRLLIPSVVVLFCNGMYKIDLVTANDYTFIGDSVLLEELYSISIAAWCKIFTLNQEVLHYS